MEVKSFTFFFLFGALLALIKCKYLICVILKKCIDVSEFFVIDRALNKTDNAYSNHTHTYIFMI